MIAVKVDMRGFAVAFYAEITRFALGTWAASLIQLYGALWERKRIDQPNG